MKKLKVILVSFFLIVLFGGCFQEPSPKRYKNTISELEFRDGFGNYNKSVGNFIKKLEKLDGKMTYSIKEIGYDRDLGNCKMLIGKSKNLELRVRFYEYNDMITVYCDNDEVNVVFSKEWAKEIGWLAWIPMGIYQFNFCSQDIFELKNKGKLK